MPALAGSQGRAKLVGTGQVPVMDYVHDGGLASPGGHPEENKLPRRGKDAGRRGNLLSLICIGQN